MSSKIAFEVNHSTGKVLESAGAVFGRRTTAHNVLEFLEGTGHVLRSFISSEENASTFGRSVCIRLLSRANGIDKKNRSP